MLSIWCTHNSLSLSFIEIIFNAECFIKNNYKIKFMISRLNDVPLYRIFKDTRLRGYAYEYYNDAIHQGSCIRWSRWQHTVENALPVLSKSLQFRVWRCYSGHNVQAIQRRYNFWTIIHWVISYVPSRVFIRVGNLPTLWRSKFWSEINITGFFHYLDDF